MRLMGCLSVRPSIVRRLRTGSSPLSFAVLCIFSSLKMFRRNGFRSE